MNEKGATKVNPPAHRPEGATQGTVPQNRLDKEIAMKTLIIFGTVEGQTGKIARYAAEVLE